MNRVFNKFYIRKRTICAFFATVFILVSSNQLWLNFKPLPIDFDIKGNGICAIEVQLNSKNNNEFDKIKSQVKTINLNKTVHAKYIINEIKYPKRFRIIFNNIKNDNPIEIKNIALKNGKYKLDDLLNFKINEGTLAVSKNSLIITPPPSISDDIPPLILTYDKKLNVRSSANFDFYIFTVILILTFLITYKLTNYIANFKTIQDKSRTDIIFLTIFFIALFIPMSYINPDKISIEEKRKLTDLQPLITNNGKINFNFGKNFNNWFQDRFFLRKELINSYIFINYNLSKHYYKNKNCVLDKKTGVFYNREDFGYNNEINQKILKNYAETINRFYKYINNKDIKIYFLIIPRKYDYYAQNNSFYEKKDNIYEIIKFLNQNTPIKFICLKESFDKANKYNPVFFKTDPHWTNTGIYCAFQEMLKEENITDFKLEKEITSKKFYNNKVLFAYIYKKSDYRIGDTARDIFNSIKLNNKLTKLYLNTNYLYYSTKNPYMTNKQKEYELYYNPNAVLDKKVLIIGNSFSEGIVLFAPYLYKNIRREDTREDLSPNPYKSIKEYNPDTIIFLFQANYFDFIIKSLRKFLAKNMERN